MDIVPYRNRYKIDIRSLTHDNSHKSIQLYTASKGLGSNACAAPNAQPLMPDDMSRVTSAPLRAKHRWSLERGWALVAFV